MISKTQLQQALQSIGYHKIPTFIHRCTIESDSETEFSSAVIKEIAWSMLDRDLEQELMKTLGL